MKVLWYLVRNGEMNDEERSTNGYYPNSFLVRLSGKRGME